MNDDDATIAAAAAFAAGDVTYLPDEPVELPPPAESDAMVLIAIRLPATLDSEVRTITKARGITISAAVREWIELGIAADRDDDQVVPLSALRRAIAHATLSSDAA